MCKEPQSQSGATLIQPRSILVRDALSSMKILHPENQELMNSLHELGGKTLGCWCRPEDCHGDILLKLLKEK